LSMCWATGYLLHIQEAFIFIIIYVPWILFEVENRESANALLLSVVLGVVLSGLVGFSYQSGMYGGLPSLVAASFCFLYLAVLNFRSIRDIFGQLIRFLLGRKMFIRSVMLVSISYLYVQAVMMYLSTSSQIDESAVYDVGFFPCSIYPIRFGLLLLIPLISFWFYGLGDSRKLLVLVPIVITHFVLTGLFDFLNSQRFVVIPFNYTRSTTGLPAYRVANLMVVPLAILCGHFIAVLSDRIKNDRKELMAFFVCGIVLLGSTSTFISAEWWTIHGGWWTSFKIGPPVSPQELEAIEWLRKNTATEDSVVALSPRSSISVLASGAKQTLSYDAFDRLAMTDIFLSSRDPVFIMQFLSSRAVDYIYTSSEDMNMIESNAKYRSAFFSTFLLHLLPVVFNNSQITIYSFPKCISPNSNSKTILSIQGHYDAASSLILYSMAEARMDFRVLWRSDGSQFNSSTIILPQDPVAEFVSITSLEGWQLQRIGDRLDIRSWESGDPSLDWSINLTNSGYHSLNYATRVPIDCRGRVFSIQMYGDGSNAVFKMLLRDINGTVDVLKEENIWWKGWKGLNIDIDSTVEDNIDFKRIVGLDIVYLAEERREGIAKIRFGDIVLSEEKELLQTIYGGYREQEQFEWIRNGGRLIVFGSSERGYFANILSIENIGERTVSGIQVANSSLCIHKATVQDLESSDKDVVAQGVYVSSDGSMPLIFRKLISLGELVFINIQPILSILERSEADGEITKLLIPVLRFLGLGPSTSHMNGISHVTFADGISFKGKLNATSRLFVPMSDNLILDELKVTDKNTIKTYRNVTLQRVRIRGPSRSTISATEAATCDVAFTAHTILAFPAGFGWSLRAGNGTTGYLVFEKGNETTTISVEGAVIDIKTSRRVRGAMENPSVDADGRVEIAKAYFEPPKNVIDGVQLLAGEYGRPLTFSGRLSYTSSIAVSEITLIDYLAFQGKVNFTRYESSFSDMNAEWSQRLLSPVGVGGLAFFIVLPLLTSRLRVLRRQRRT